MEVHGIANGRVIQLDEPLPFEVGSLVIVKVDLVSQGRPGDWLTLAGTMSVQEADLISEIARESRQLDKQAWLGP